MENFVNYFLNIQNFDITRSIEYIILTVYIHFTEEKDMKINEAVAKRVEQLLEKHSRTQYAVAKEGGISNSTFCTTLSGRCRSRVDTVLNICRGFNITLEEFFNSRNYSRKTIFQTIEAAIRKKREPSEMPDSLFSVFNDLAPM